MSVPDWVSSFKRSPYARITGESIIGFENATLRWNTGKQSETSSSKDTAKSSTEPSSPTTSDGTTAVETENAVFNLTNLNVKFPLGKLSVVTGPTGSGKTAILTALLGEMELLEGESFLPKYPTSVDKETGLRNSVAYAAQTPWLQQKSIKDNILFGEEFDEKRYEATLEACALLPDLEVLEDGDMTEIGAKGVSLRYAALHPSETLLTLPVVDRKPELLLLELYILTPSMSSWTIHWLQSTLTLPSTLPIAA